MKDVFIYPWKPGSSSAASLAQALGAVRRISHVNSSFVGRAKHTVVNWGSSSVPPNVLSAGRVLNAPETVRNASNKLNFFRAATAAGTDGPPIPPWTTSRAEAATWLAEGVCRMVVARTVLSGHSGEGIVLVETQEQLQAIPEGTLLVQYVPKRAEFRLHVARGVGVFDFAKKAVRLGTDQPPNYQIQNHANGFVYARENVQLPSPACATAAERALAVSALDFGAVDLIWNERSKQAYVLEVNTAPGLEGQTAVNYGVALARLIGG